MATSLIENDLDRQLFIRLRDSEIDLQTELSALADEIVSREIRLIEALGQLRRTREQMRRQLRDAAIEGATA